LILDTTAGPVVQRLHAICTRSACFCTRELRCCDGEKDHRKAAGAAQMPSVIVNGTELYYEIRGAGSPVLLIMGAAGDGGHLDAFAEMLADEFMVRTLVQEAMEAGAPPAAVERC
jgi:hypothetical protein